MTAFVLPSGEIGEVSGESPVPHYIFLNPPGVFTTAQRASFHGIVNRR
jgi:hypothetical protein